MPQVLKYFVFYFVNFLFSSQEHFFSLCYTNEKKIIKKHILEHTKWSTKKKKVSLAPQGFRRDNVHENPCFHSSGNF